MGQRRNGERDVDWSPVARASRGPTPSTSDQTPQVESLQAWIPDHPSSGGLRADVPEFLENYRMRFARSPANVGDVGPHNGRGSGGDSQAQRRQRAGVLFLASTPGASGYRSHGIDAVVCESHGRTGNRMPGRSSGTDSRSRATEAET